MYTLVVFDIARRMFKCLILFAALALCKCISATASSGCRSAKADIVFLLDASGSVGNVNFEIQKEFVANFSKAFDIGQNNVQISVVTFSTFPHEEFKLNSNRNLPQLVAAINKINYTQGATFTFEALHFARNNSFTAAAGDRQDVTNILIVMTDGTSNVPTLTSIESNLVHQLDIQVLAIGIGKYVDRNELKIMASSPQDVFPVKSFDALFNALNIIQIATCNIAAKITTKNTAAITTNIPNKPSADAVTKSTSKPSTAKIPTLSTTSALSSKPSTTAPRAASTPTRIVATTTAPTPDSSATTKNIRQSTTLFNTNIKIATSPRSTLNETVVEVADKTHIMVCILVGSILTVLILIFIIKQHCTFPGKHKKGKMSIDALDF